MALIMALWLLSAAIKCQNISCCFFVLTNCGGGHFKKNCMCSSMTFNKISSKASGWSVCRIDKKLLQIPNAHMSIDTRNPQTANMNRCKTLSAVLGYPESLKFLGWPLN